MSVMTVCCSTSWRRRAIVSFVENARDIWSSCRHWRHCRKSHENYWQGTSAARSVQPSRYFRLLSSQAFYGGMFCKALLSCSAVFQNCVVHLVLFIELLNW